MMGLSNWGSYWGTYPYSPFSGTFTICILTTFDDINPALPIMRDIPIIPIVSSP